jgi:adenylosuccinate lyase
VDTAQALQIKNASGLIKKGLDELSAALKKLAFEHKNTVQMGRTHGMHAEPITFGLKVALWWDEFQRHQGRFAAASEEMRVGKISGAVGTFAHIGPEAEEKICERLGLKAAPITSQVLSRDLHAYYIAVLAGIAPWRSGICSGPKFARPKSRLLPGRRVRRRCRTSVTLSCVNRSADWHAW